MKSFLMSIGTVFVLAIAGCSTTVVESENPNNMMKDNAGNNSMDSNNTMNGDLSDMTDNFSDGGMKSIYFGFDKFDVSGNNLNVVSQNAKVILNDKIMVKVEGNSDERGTDEYNYALALKRASSVKTVLVNNGVDPKNISIVSYGESKPKCNEQTPQCWKKNRRVDFIVVK